MLDTAKILEKLGIKEVNSGVYAGGWVENPKGETIESKSPIDGKVIAKIVCASEEDYENTVKIAQESYKKWRMIPAPQRGEIVRLIGNRLREYKDELGALVTMEMGKILPEGKGEVQEMIDIADFAVGLSRQLYGLTMHSERAYHRMYEQWHPLGVIGVITSFNFPVAVWAWNTMISAVCGDSNIWKPSSKTPLTAIAVQNIIDDILEEHDCKGIFNLIIGRGRTVGTKLLEDKRLPLISFTGSIPMGRVVSETVGKRLGRSLLELGGNNAIIITPSTDMKLVIRAVLFGAVGTAGQRCTSTRRLIIHDSIYDEVIEKLIKAYKQVTIGNPLEEGILCGPVVEEKAVENMMAALEKAKKDGGKILYGGEHLDSSEYGSDMYVRPAIVEANPDMDIVKEETFAPVLYVMKYKDIDEAIEIHNSVDQGLSSAIFSENMKEIEKFLSHRGSDCGIANVNIGTSGAEIGGAFGGEKETGGGRESGSDSWKVYMRRQTNTINWGDELPLAQGIKFGD